MKKLLFVLPSFMIGGTTVSIKNLILLLDKNQYGITVLPLCKIGSLSHLYEDVGYVNPPFFIKALALPSWKKENGIVIQLLCAITRFLCNRSSRLRQQILKFYANRLTSTSHFDVIVACEEGLVTEFVSYSPNKNKVAWIRCDYSRYLKSKNYIKEEKNYSQFQNIVCVSEIMKDKFIKIFPHFVDKVHAINNPQSEEFIMQQSTINDADSLFVKDIYTIVSVGRLNPIKRFSYIPVIASELKQKDLQFRWYIIGGGNDSEEELIRQNIILHNVQDEVICLGPKTNPHYYIANANLLVSLSISEACPRVINEAKILHTPVVCTDFDSAKEYINSEKTGIICSMDKMAMQIERMMKDNTLVSKIRKNIVTFSFDNVELMKQIHKVL